MMFTDDDLKRLKENCEQRVNAGFFSMNSLNGLAMIARLEAAEKSREKADQLIASLLKDKELCMLAWSGEEHCLEPHGQIDNEVHAYSTEKKVWRKAAGK